MPDRDLFLDAERHACACGRRAGEPFTLPGAAKHYPPDLEVEPVHMDVSLRLDLEAREVDGAVIVSVEPRRKGPRELTLHGVGFEDVAVDSPDGDSLVWTYDGDEIRVVWDEPFGTEPRRVAVRYRAVRPRAGILFGGPTEAEPDAPRYAVTDNETELARHWMPCVDLPSVRPTLDLRVRAEARLTRLANGALVGEEEHDDGTATSHWRLEVPCPSYLTCVAVGEFIRHDDEAFEGLPVAAFTTRDRDPEELARSFGRTREMLAWMTDKLGVPFPFPKYYQCAVDGLAGAMENISLVTWGGGFLLDEELAGEWQHVVDTVNVHEMAHSYFGDLVVCRDFAHAWLKEGWATFMEQCWHEDRVGADEGLWELWQNFCAYFSEADERYKRPIVTREFHSSWEMYDRHLYPGSAARLHTLRSELGEETFWEAVRTYVETWRGRTVETDDFRRVLEAHSGRSLGRFFDQWFRTPGYPALKVGFSWDPRRGEGTFEIEQTQVDEEAGVPAFELPLELGWVVDGELSTREVRLKEAKQVVPVPMEREPEQVRVDPHVRTLLKLDFNPGDDKLKRQLREAPDIVGRILAGRELCGTGKPGCIDAVIAAWAEEPFWGVRVEHARALADAATRPALDALADFVGREEDPKALALVIRAAGRFRDATIARAVQERLDAVLPHRARAAAFEALGRQREDAPFDRIAEAARVRSHNGLAQAGALRGLAGTRRPEGVGQLVEQSGVGGAHPLARPAATRALADVGRVSERPARERVVERLVEHLRDPEPRVQKAAVDGLRDLRAREATGALEAHARRLPHQDRVHVEQVLRDLREQGEPKAGAAQQAMDAVDARLRKMEERLRRLEGRLDPGE